MTDTYTVLDLVRYVDEGKPLEFEKAFGSITRERAEQLVDDKKLEVADAFFGGTVPPNERPESEVDELEDDIDPDAEVDPDDEDEVDPDGEEEDEDGEES